MRGKMVRMPGGQFSNDWVRILWRGEAWGMPSQQDSHWRHHRFGHVMRIRYS
jgi:hypothetical protein